MVKRLDMSDNTIKIKKFIEKCNEFENCKFLFMDKKIGELLEIVIQTKEIHDLVSECLDNFNRDKEYDKSFVTDSNGRKYYVPPKEEYKIIALAFCVLADVSSGRKSLDTIITKFFQDDNGKKDYIQFVEKIIFSFRDLVAEAFGVNAYAIGFISNSGHVDDEEAHLEQFKEIVETPIERVSQRLYEGCDVKSIFDQVRGLAKNILESLESEKRNEYVNDCELVCHSIIIACLDENYDTLHGLVLGLKHIGKNIRSVRFYTREIVSLVQDQIDWDV